MLFLNSVNMEILNKLVLMVWPWIYFGGIILIKGQYMLALFERPLWLTILTVFYGSLTESCCITEAGSSDVPLKSQWKVLTWLVRTALQMPFSLLTSSSQELHALRADLNFFLSDGFTFLIDQGSVIIVFFFPCQFCYIFKSDILISIIK